MSRLIMPNGFRAILPGQQGLRTVLVAGQECICCDQEPCPEGDCQLLLQNQLCEFKTFTASISLQQNWTCCKEVVGQPAHSWWRLNYSGVPSIQFQVPFDNCGGTFIIPAIGTLHAELHGNDCQFPLGYQCSYTMNARVEYGLIDSSWHGPWIRVFIGPADIEACFLWGVVLFFHANVNIAELTCEQVRRTYSMLAFNSEPPSCNFSASAACNVGGGFDCPYPPIVPEGECCIEVACEPGDGCGPPEDPDLGCPYFTVCQGCKSGLPTGLKAVKIHNLCDYQVLVEVRTATPWFESLSAFVSVPANGTVCVLLRLTQEACNLSVGLHEGYVVLVQYDQQGDPACAKLHRVTVNVVPDSDPCLGCCRNFFPTSLLIANEQADICERCCDFGGNDRQRWVIEGRLNKQHLVEQIGTCTWQWDDFPDNPPPYTEIEWFNRKRYFHPNDADCLLPGQLTDDETHKIIGAHFDIEFNGGQPIIWVYLRVLIGETWIGVPIGYRVYESCDELYQNKIGENQNGSTYMTLVNQYCAGQACACTCANAQGAPQFTIEHKIEIIFRDYP